MCQNMPDVDSTKGIIDFGNQPEPIAFNVKDCPLPDGVRIRKSLPYVCQIFPFSLLCNPKPRVKRNFKFPVPRGRVLKLLAADYVQCRSSRVRNLRTLYFSKRETVKNI
jgi:hypothetical protein